VELNAAGILASLASAVLAAQSAADRAALAGLAASFAIASVVLARVALPDVSVLAFCIAAAQMAALARPRWRLLPPLAAGVFAAAWTSILEAQGLPWAPAALAAAALLLAAAGLGARRAGFTSAELRDEALVLVGSFAVLLAIVPDVVAGWRAAVALAAEPLTAETPAVGPWLVALVVASVLMGGAYSLWKRR
jgi:hypothetical protein